MTTPTYNGFASAQSTTVNFTLPYGTELLVIFGGKFDTSTNSSAPTGATYNSVAGSAAGSASATNGIDETSCAIFFLRKESLPAAGSSYAAAITGGSGADSFIVVAAFGGIEWQTTPLKTTDENVGTWNTALNGLKDDLMLGVVMTYTAGQATLSTGATEIDTVTTGGGAFASMTAVYHILTADESPHTIAWTGAGESVEDTAVSAMLSSLTAIGGAIWM